MNRVDVTMQELQANKKLFSFCSLRKEPDEIWWRKVKISDKLMIAKFDYQKILMETDLQCRVASIVRLADRGVF